MMLAACGTQDNHPIIDLALMEFGGLSAFKLGCNPGFCSQLDVFGAPGATDTS